MPLIELLLLLLLLLRTALLHGRRLPHEWMRLLRSRLYLLRLWWMEFAIRRLSVAILLQLHIIVGWSVVRPVVGSVVRRRSSLLLVAPGLRLRQLPDLAVAIVRLTERPETVLGRLRAAPLIHLSWP